MAVNIYDTNTAGGGGGGSVTADNGLTAVSSNVELGGTLIRNTTIDPATFQLLIGALTLKSNAAQLSVAPVNPTDLVRLQDLAAYALLAGNNVFSGTNRFNADVDIDANLTVNFNAEVGDLVVNGDTRLLGSAINTSGVMFSDLGYMEQSANLRMYGTNGLRMGMGDSVNSNYLASFNDSSGLPIQLPNVTETQRLAIDVTTANPTAAMCYQTNSGVNSYGLYVYVSTSPFVGWFRILETKDAAYYVVKPGELQNQTASVNALTYLTPTTSGLVNYIYRLNINLFVGTVVGSIVVSFTYTNHSGTVVTVTETAVTVAGNPQYQPFIFKAEHGTNITVDVALTGTGTFDIFTALEVLGSV